MPSNRRNLLASSGIDNAVEAEAVDFDGSNDYLSRSSDLTGNADGNSLTFSAWVYKSVDGATTRIYCDGQSSGTDSGFQVYAGSNDLVFLARNSADVTILGVHAYTNILPKNTWTHILASFDLSNSSNRFIYLNDVNETASFTFGQYSSDDINFTTTTHQVGKAANISSQLIDGRLAHLFLDYTYRDLSVEVNRRHFITADLKPAGGEEALSPILYLPMTDPDTVQVNSGTGGDFTLNGTVARSGRGPNQDNCSASDLAVTNDYLYSSTFTPMTITTATISFSFVKKAAANMYLLSWGVNGTSLGGYMNTNSGDFLFKNSSGTVVIQGGWTTNIFAAAEVERTNHVTISVDITDAAKRFVFINGVDRTSDYNFTTYNTAETMYINNEFNVNGYFRSTSVVACDIGELYFDDAYTDLAAENPFWDSTLNKPVSVRKVIDDTGVTPLVALPMIGSDAGNNLGTGGDFTVNSGPFTGARGASEFWARSVDFDGSTDYYSRTSALSGASDGKVVNGFFAIRPDTVSGTENIFTIVNGSSERFAISRTTTNILIEAWNAAGSQILSATATATLALNTWAVIHFNFNLASSTNRSISKAGTNLSVSWGTFTDDSIELSSTEQYIGSGDAGGSLYGGDLAIMWLDFGTEIDFTDEATRLIYSDALGFPTDLQAAIDAGTSPQGIVHMKFDDSSAFGTNSGSGGVFTEAGTPVAGPDVNP